MEEEIKDKDGKEYVKFDQRSITEKVQELITVIERMGLRAYGTITDPTVKDGTNSMRFTVKMDAAEVLGSMEFFKMEKACEVNINMMAAMANRAKGKQK